MSTARTDFTPTTESSIQTPANTESKAASWFWAVTIHTGRHLRRWLRSPAILVTAAVFPVTMMLTVVLIFGGMIEEFTGAELELTGIAVMVSVSSMLTAAVMGAGVTVQERHEGFMDRIHTLPGHPSAGYGGRILAESLRGFFAAPVTILIALAFGAEFGTLAAVARMLAVLFLVSIASGAFGVMMGYLAETPQGAVVATPVIMIAMFFNNALMPSELYAAPLRPLVDISPITAVANLTQDALTNETSGAHIGLFAIWFGGLTLLSVAVIVTKERLRR